MACGGTGGSQNATSRKITIEMVIWVKSLQFHQISLNPPTPQITTTTTTLTALTMWSLVERLELTTFSDPLSFCQILHDLWLCMTFDHQLVYPHYVRQQHEKDGPGGTHYVLHLMAHASHDKGASIVARWWSWSGRCAAHLFQKILRISQYYPGRWCQ